MFTELPIKQFDISYDQPAEVVEVTTPTNE
jgi:hypothetical protein